MEQMRKGGREVTEGSKQSNTQMGAVAYDTPQKVRVRRQRPRGRGGQWKGRTVGSHVVWSQPSFSQGSWPLSVRVLYKSRMDTNSSTQSSSQVARHRCSYGRSTHSPWSLPGRFGGSWLARLQGHRRCLFYMWDREAAGTLATKPAEETEVNFPTGQIKWESSNLLALASVTSVLGSLRPL